MNVLVILAALNGVAYHRLAVPFGKMARRGQAKVSLFLTGQHGKPDDLTPFQLKNFDVVVFNRNISAHLNPEKLIAKVRMAGCLLVCDVDDHWNIGKKHVLGDYYARSNMSRCIERNILLSDLILASTGILKREIEAKFPNKVIVVKNCIDAEEDQFSLSGNIHSYSRLSFSGSITHREDLLEVFTDYERQKFSHPFTISGFSEEWPWQDCRTFGERIGMRIDTEGIRKVNEYASDYLDKGICFAPLVHNKFNLYKSELKVLEAGWFSKAVICSSIATFSPLARHMENCIVSKPNEWAKWTKILLGNFRLQDDLRGRLRQDIDKRYDLDRENDKRLEAITDKLKRKNDRKSINLNGGA